MSQALSPSAIKIQEALKAQGLRCQVVEMRETTRSAMDAAHALGCRVEQIVKTLVFKTTKTNRPILVAASGANRVNVKTLGQFLSEPIKMADADFVREKTGFAIGGVPPLGHPRPLKTYIDEDLLKNDEIWAAAGSPNAMFRLTPKDLQKITAGEIISVK
jgi:Cys-tRNA(Pro) deacylase